MPFTLAHPAAVLPFRRYCPRLLDFPALVIGSLAPDTGYLIGRANPETFSHDPLGSLLFCLPVGLVAVAGFYLLRTPAVLLLPEKQRQLFLPLCRRPAAAWLAIVISLLLGVWTHLLSDMVTHNDGWAAMHFPILQRPVLSIAGRTMTVSHVFWYVCSFTGVAWLYFHFERWRRGVANSSLRETDGGIFLGAATVGALSVFIAFIHHVVHGFIGVWIAVALSLLLVLAILMRAQPAVR